MLLKNFTTCFAVVIAIAFTSNAHAVEIGGNLSFEDALGAGDPTTDPLNWFGFTGPGAVGVGTNTTAPFDGATQAEISFAGSTDSFAGFQQFVPDITPGENYTFSIFGSTDGELFDIVNELRIEFFDAAGAEVGRTDNVNPILTTTYEQFSQSGVAPAGTASLRAVFAGQSFNGATGTGLVRLDSASIQGPNVVPEPSSLALLAIVSAGVMGRRRRRRR